MCSDCPADFVGISLKGEYTGVMLVVLPCRLLRQSGETEEPEARS